VAGLAALVAGFPALLTGCGEYSLGTQVTEVLPYETVAEEFTQAPVASRDILWMIDNSYSMYDEAQRLAPEFETFIDAITQYGISYQVGIVTSDAENDKGRLEGLPWIISPDTPDANAVFAQNVTIIINSILDDYTAGPEKGLEAVREALSPAMAQPGARNYGFLRADAGLSIIAVSDRDDLSEDDVSAYEQFLIDLKGGSTPDRITFSAIVGTAPEGCDGGEGIHASYGARYIALAELFGGDVESLCDADFSAVVARLGDEPVQRKSTFPLSHVPVADSLVVQVDGAVMEEDVAWIYDPQRQAVVFASDHLPDFGATIRALYQYDPR
jgi:hypothetical protein